MQRYTEVYVDVCGGMQRFTQRCVEVYAEVHGGLCGGAHGGTQRCREVYAEVCGGAWRFRLSFFQEVVGKNQGFMLIRLLNAMMWLDVVGTINQILCRGVQRFTVSAQRFFQEVVGKNEGFMLIRLLNAMMWLEVVRTINQNLCGGVQRFMWRYTEVYVEVPRGLCQGAQRFFQEEVGKNQGFMLIRLLNAIMWLDVVGTINQILHRGGWRFTWRCTQVYMEVYTEVHLGFFQEVVGKTRVYVN